MISAELKAKGTATQVVVVDLEGKQCDPTCPACGNASKPLLNAGLPAPRRTVILCLRRDERYSAVVGGERREE